MIVYTLAIAIAIAIGLGSWWAAIAALLVAVGFGVRTAL